jgi:hypothetical protein
VEVKAVLRIAYSNQKLKQQILDFTDLWHKDLMHTFYHSEVKHTKKYL